MIQQLEPGALLERRYRIQRLLGQGGMGAVGRSVYLGRRRHQRATKRGDIEQRAEDHDHRSAASADERSSPATTNPRVYPGL